MSLLAHTVKFLDGDDHTDSASAVIGIFNNVANAAGSGAGVPVATPVTLQGDVPTSYNVQVTPSQACFVSVAKNGATVTVTLTPPASSDTLAAGTFDMLVTA